MSHKRCLWFSFVFFSPGKLCGTWFPPPGRLRALRSPSSRECQAMKKAKAKVKLNKDTAGDLRETKHWHPILMWKPCAIFCLYLETYQFVYNMFSSNRIFREVNCRNNFYLYLVSYIWLACPLSSYDVVFSESTRVIIPCVSHEAVVAYWPPKKAVYFSESGHHYH